MSESGAQPTPNATKVGPAAVPQIRKAGPIGFGTDNNNQDSAKRPSPGCPAPDSHVNTPSGKP